MRNLEISEKLIEKFKSEPKAKNELLHYPGILMILGALKTAELTGDKKLLDEMVEYLREFPSQKHPAYNFRLYEVEEKYGYCGLTAPWTVAGLKLEGGAGQLNTVFSWGTLCASGLIYDTATAEIK